MKEFATAFAKAQAQIKTALKESENPAFKQGQKVSRYADLGSVWDACRAALAENGFSVLQPTNFDGQDFWLETMLLHASGEMVTARYPIRPSANTPQSVGSAITYARRYALSAMLGVVADEDDDGNAASQRHAEKPDLRAVEAPQSTMAGRKVEADGIRAAREWVNSEAIPAVKACKTAEALNVWVDANSKTIAKLKTVLPDEHKALSDRIDVKADSFNAVAAG